MSVFLFRKEVDQSLLKSGLTIPFNMHGKIQDAVGAQLTKGQKTDIRILLDGQVYEAVLTNVNLSDQYANRVVFQIRYSEGNPICQKLKSLFAATDLSASKGNRNYIEVFANDDKTLEFKVNSDMKETFFKYIGPADSLTGYQRSYKLVFCKAFFTRIMENQETDCDTVDSSFRQYYVERKKAGLVPDVDADPVISDIEKSTLAQIHNLILRNPFNAISSRGFISIEDNEKKRYVLNPSLKNQLTAEDIHSILDLVHQKLKLYYSSIDRADSKGGNMREIIEKILNDYVPAKKEPFAGHPLGMYFRNDIPRKLYETGLVNSSNYLVTGSVGQGNWAMIPWVCIFDRSITTTATKGVYIVYLLEKDGNSLYLTFNQGCTDIRNSHSKRETIRIMREKASEIVSRIDSRGFQTDERINLGEGVSSLGELYQKGTIFYKEYRKNAIPSEAELRNDLANMMEIYREYVNRDAAPEQKAWLLSWNPNNWNWEDYDNATSKTQNGEAYDTVWTCANTHVSLGDRVFLTVLGNGDRNGIIASGIAQSGSFESEHWDPEKRKQGIKAKRIKVRFDSILDYRSQEVLRQSLLNEKFPEQQWNPQGSGIEIKPHYIMPLEAEWERVKDQALGGEEELTIKETINRIKDYIEAKGFSYENGLIENFYLSLKSKPFVILAGTSGTGKTRLVRLFAEAVGATVGNGRYKMVSVRPDWSDSTDLFGHVDLNGRFCPGAIIDFVKQAASDRAHPYFLCLDEMNLARVEYYLSDFLSVIETRDYQNGHIVSEPLVSEPYYGSDADAAGRYGTVPFPENLYVVGTVNMDETTFPFSRKVLDRANTIEFSFVDLMPPTEWAPSSPVALDVGNDFLKSQYLLLAQCADQQESVNQYCAELQRLNRILQQANAHVGYRVRDEVVFYLLNNKAADLLPDNAAMDNEIMQKILPRIQGSSASIKNMLCELFKVCAGDYEGQNTESDLSSKMMKAAQKSDCKYVKSARKIAFMVRRFEEDGFTSYWL